MVGTINLRTSAMTINLTPFWSKRRQINFKNLLKNHRIKIGGEQSEIN